MLRVGHCACGRLVSGLINGRLPVEGDATLKLVDA
jgi:hypothetical protein